MKFSSFYPCAALLALRATLALHADQPASEPTPVQLTPAPELKLVEQFDRNGDHFLDATERQAARRYLAQHPPANSTAPSGRPAPQAFQATALEPVKPGEKRTAAGAPAFPDRPLYDPDTVRTLFLDFADSDWEKQLTEFARTDVLIPARLSVDGNLYPGVGVRFHTPTATPATAEGYKRALDLTLDATVAGQKIGGQRQLRLLDAATDATLLRAVLYSRVAQPFLPAAPKANFVRVVINGENWGVYVSAQPFDENFLKENFKTTEGARWTVLPGGNFTYLGDKADAYRGFYHLDTAEDPAAWTALIALCKVLKESTTNQLEAALAAHLDLDCALRFLALENVLINQSGYGSSTGGFSLYLATDGHFRLIPQEAEASLRLIEISEYGSRPQRAGRESDGKAKEKGKNKTSDDLAGNTAVDPTLPNYNHQDFPRQSGSDLAMLLSYSFINKADSDFSGKIDKEEWLTFARSWFLVMDEDLVGSLTRDQFLAKFRNLLTPASIADGRTKQTYGHDDPARIIGEDLFNAFDSNRDSQITSQEVTATFAQWFTAWSDPKTGILTEAALQRGFTPLLSRTIFQADETYIAKRDIPVLDDAPSGGRGRGGKGGGSGVNGALNVGPMRLGKGGWGGKGDNSRGLVTFSEELDPLAALDETTKPLLTRLLSIPVLRTRYLEYVHDLNETWLNWATLGPIAKRYHELIAADVGKETHKSTSYVHFVQELDQDTTPGSRDGDAAPSLKNFITERHAFLRKDDSVLGP